MTGPSAVLSGKKILVVEDDSSLSPLLRLLIEEAGAMVQVASDPQEALQAMAIMKPIDILISDVVLPSRSGFQLAEELAEIQPGIRVLFMSGFGDPEIGARELLIPFDTLLKPFLPEDFLAKIVGLLARKIR
jgi:DNA-binding response OmpR family regulator